MRRFPKLAISVLALTAFSQQIFAAEMETPTPTEQAAPPAEREPAARPARERRPARTAPERTQTAQTSSYTGTQAGGFGGGNVGGGGFADPICLTSFGLNNGCIGAPFSQSLTKTGGRGGAVVQWTMPVTPWIVVGVLGDLSFGNNSVTQTQNHFYSDTEGFVTTETIQNTVTQRTSGSARLKAGFVVPLGYTSIMPYTTVGWTRAQIQGSFTYAASNYFPSSSESPGCSAFASCSTIAASTVNYTANRNGVIWGFGVEMPLPALGPGVVLVLDYSRSQFGSFDVSLPAVVTSVAGSPCASSGVSPCSIVDIGHFSNVSFSTFSVGARFKFF
jgi:opacity protein-like surface antigen